MTQLQETPDRRISKKETILLLMLLLLALGLLLAGLIMPMMTITKLVFFSNSFSVLQGVYELYLNDHLFLFVLVTGFSIVLPLIKIGLLFKLISVGVHHSKTSDRLLHLAHDYGRWAMLDVMVVAILIVTVKLGAIASIEVHSGLYVFGLAVLLIMFITNRVVKLRSL